MVGEYLCSFSHNHSRSPTLWPWSLRGGVGEGLCIHDYTTDVGLCATWSSIKGGKKVLALGEVTWDLVGCSRNNYEMSDMPAAPQGATRTQQELIMRGKVFRIPLSFQLIKALVITADFTFPNKAQSFPKYFRGR